MTSQAPTQGPTDAGLTARVLSSEWQPIASHPEKYEISQSGVVHDKSGRILKQWLNDQGYALVRLSSPRVVQRVHRLVAVAFIPNPDGLPFVNHLDFDRANNDAMNLEWCTQWHNINHSKIAGRMQNNFWIGKRSPNARLSDDTAKTIRMIYESGGTSWASIGKDFNISKRSVGRIIAGESYV